DVVIPIPSARSAPLRGIVESAGGAGVTDIRIPRGVNELLSTGAGLKDIRDVNLDDLLGRPPVTIAMDALAAFLANRRVLVTGAAGSIGQELVRQLTRFQCAEIIAVDVRESGLFEVEEMVTSLQTSTT